MMAKWLNKPSRSSVALGKVVFTSRETRHRTGSAWQEMGVTLRYPYEVRKEEEYFDDIPAEKVPKDMLDLAKHIVETKKAHFEPERFEDRYEDALKDLLKKKQHGEKIERPKEREPAKVVNLMDALRRSVQAEGDTARRKTDRLVITALRKRPDIQAQDKRKRVDKAPLATTALARS
jgi:DNA end-binding protein Ku